MLTSDRPIITRTTAHTMAEQEHFIHQNADALSYFGYARYREGGRGLIALFPDEVLDERGRVGKGNLYYLQADDLLPLLDRWEEDSEARNEFLHDLWDTIEMYDPDHSVIVSFLSLTPAKDDNRINTYLVDCVTPPPLAYAAYTN